MSNTEDPAVLLYQKIITSPHNDIIEWMKNSFFLFGDKDLTREVDRVVRDPSWERVYDGTAEIDPLLDKRLTWIVARYVYHNVARGGTPRELTEYRNIALEPSNVFYFYRMELYYTDHDINNFYKRFVSNFFRLGQHYGYDPETNYQRLIDVFYKNNRIEDTAPPKTRFIEKYFKRFGVKPRIDRDFVPDSQLISAERYLELKETYGEDSKRLYVELNSFFN